MHAIRPVLLLRERGWHGWGQAVRSVSSLIVILRSFREAEKREKTAGGAALECRFDAQSINQGSNSHFLLLLLS
jgi:hypothetical protein